jgi:hypothetical protein
MKNKNKYYTPSIEEFHVGFEYEELRIITEGYIETTEDCDFTENTEGATWTSTTFNIIQESDWEDLKYRFRYEKYNKAYHRVKYLDKEDIESLGFKYIMTSYNGYYKKDNIELGVAYDKRIQIKTDEGFVFLGIIKNKSELKRLLNQLGIYE